MTITTAIFAAVGALVVLFSLLNYMAGELSPFGFAIMLTGVGIALIPLAGHVIKMLSKKWYKILSIFLYCAVAVCLTVMIALTSIMVPAAHDDLSGVSADTPLIVPGCFLHGDKPGKMLQNRLDAAESYLKSHPDAVCVVCGGYIGEYTQAEVMKNSLVQSGVLPSRILVDDKSNTTYENMENAKKLLSDTKDVVIATDVYHQYRSKYYAKKFGFTPYALASKTPARHYVDSWPREYLAVIKAWITGK